MALHGGAVCVSIITSRCAAICAHAAAVSDWQLQVDGLYLFFELQESAFPCAGQQPARYLTVDGNTGLADRLVADVSGLAVAIMTNRAFVLTDHLGGEKAGPLTMLTIPVCRQDAFSTLKTDASSDMYLLLLGIYSCHKALQALAQLNVHAGPAEQFVLLSIHSMAAQAEESRQHDKIELLVGE